MAELDVSIVHLVVAKISVGTVASYGQIANLAGYPGKARWVGKILAQLPEDSTLPWHRVLNSQGVIRGPHLALARARLIAEGVVVKNNRVDIHRYRWMTKAHIDDNRQ